MTLDDAELSLALAAWRRLLTDRLPVERILAHLFSTRQSGALQRQRVGDVVYTALRHRRALLACLGPAATDEALLALAAAGPPPVSPDWPPAVRYSLPDWWWNALRGERGELAEPLAAALLQTAPVDLRVNLQRASLAQVREALQQAGVAATELEGLPAGLRLVGHPSVEGLPLFQNGWCEVQDAGAQRIGHLLNPQPGERIIDLCAGAGGKTLHLADLMAGRGQLLACDVDAQRLQAARPRLKRAKVTMVHLQLLSNERDAKLRAWTGKADAVLVDAPCSGSGTVRRQPERKWRLDEAGVSGYQQKQLALLEAAAVLVRPGGRLIYATCSLWWAENEAVVEEFLKGQPGFRLRPPAGGAYQHFDPLTTGCDGFFAALLQRR